MQVENYFIHWDLATVLNFSRGKEAIPNIKLTI